MNLLQYGMTSDASHTLVKEKIFYFNCQEIMDEEKEIKTQTQE